MLSCLSFEQSSQAPRTYLQITMATRFKRMMQGIALAFGAPLGWLGIEMLVGVSPLEALRGNPAVYLYMLLGSLIAFGCFGYVLGIHEEKLSRYSTTDALTGLFNYRFFQMRFEEDFAAALRYREPIAVSVIDIDFFKQINDRYGHPIGDRVLKEVAGMIQHVVRRGETLARVGGEEFVLLTPRTTMEHAELVAERVRSTIATHPIVLPTNEKIEVKVSIGVSGIDTPTHAHNPKTLYEMADRALYEAKRNGRNCVVSANYVA